MRNNFIALLLVVLLLMCVGVYWVGLSGGYLFDDTANLSAVAAWQRGEIGLSAALFSNVSSSLLDQRALAMASFAGSAALSEAMHPFTFKLHNLILHCIVGLSIFGFVRSLLAHDSNLAPRRDLFALAVTAVWLLHPLHASTVLYIVQRMAQLSALFSIWGMWLYLAGRRQLRAGREKRAAVCLLIGVPVLAFLAIQGKQSGAILPFLCAAIELVYFREWPRPRLVKVFMVTFCLLPIMAVGAILVVKPALLLASYGEYDFGVYERLLSQMRALMTYLVQFVAPHTPSMGVFTDDFPVSRGLLAPITTFASLIGLVTLTGLAILLGRKQPTVLAGWLIFLIAHAVESGFLPLELYYEHRNYLPSVGLLLSLASLTHVAGAWLTSRGIRTGRIAIPIGICLLLALGLMTHGRARVWGDPLVLVRSELTGSPESFRAVANYVTIASDLGDSTRAYAVINDRIARAESTTLQGRSYLLRVWLDCVHKRAASAEDLSSGVRLLPKRVELSTFLIFDLLTEVLDKHGCGNVDAIKMATALRYVADNATEQPDNFNLKWALRNKAALLFSEAGMWSEAAEQARLGWQPSTPAAGAAFLVEILLVQGDLTAAQRILREARERNGDDQANRVMLDRISKLVDEEVKTPGWNRTRVTLPTQD